MIKKYLRNLLTATFLLASGAGELALAELEAETNDSIGSPQRLVIGDTGKIEVTGSIGVLTMGQPDVPDVDFYSFEGKEGDLVTLDIDGGMKPLFVSDVRAVDTLIAIFGPDLVIIDQNDDAATADAGSTATSRGGTVDARLEQVRLPVSGTYIVGVASAARYANGLSRVFVNGGGLTPYVSSIVSNGSYTLLIEGVTPAPLAKQINIDVKPGADSIRPLNPKSKGSIPVALLSAADFNALHVDRDSVRFGPSGSEARGRCGKDGEDVNGDGLLDLVCHFDNQEARFHESHDRGMVKGVMRGKPFEGRGWLKVIPVKQN